MEYDQYILIFFELVVKYLVYKADPGIIRPGQKRKNGKKFLQKWQLEIVAGERRNGIFFQHGGNAVNCGNHSIFILCIWIEKRYIVAGEKTAVAE